MAVVGWWLGASQLARLTADAHVACRADNLLPFAALGPQLWRYGSVFLFLLAGTGLLAFVDRGRRLVRVCVCLVIAGLLTWGHVAITHAVMRYSAEHGASMGMPVDSRGEYHDPCVATQAGGHASASPQRSMIGLP
ncbi:hypothetical protein GCM10027199_61510 [Amycolatopsis magusensis]